MRHMVNVQRRADGDDVNLNTPQTREILVTRRWWQRRNWLGESKNQEFLRRLQAVESSVRNAHDRINEIDSRKADR